MKIKITKDHKDERRTYKKGKVISCTSELADKLIKDKVAVSASDEAYEAEKEKKNKSLDEEHKIK